MTERIVLFTACVSSLFAPPEGPTAERGLRLLCERAGVELVAPTGIDALCCGTPWLSKGYSGGATSISRRTFDALWEASEQGGLAITCDASSCTQGLRELELRLDAERRARFAKLRFEDSVTLARRLLRLTPHRRVRRNAVLHPTCSTEHLGSTDDLIEVAGELAEEVTVPLDWGCCGYAGDRGMLHPELTESATREEAREVGERSYDAYLSSNRTCEMGMERATGRPYTHVLGLLPEALET